MIPGGYSASGSSSATGGHAGGSSNVVGNIGGNLAELIQLANQGAAANGGEGTILSSPISAYMPSPSLMNSGGFGAGLPIIPILALGAIAVVFFMIRK